MPTGHEMPSMSRSPPPQEMSLAANGAEKVEEGMARLLPPERVQEGRVRFKVQHPQASSWPRLKR